MTHTSDTGPEIDAEGLEDDAAVDEIGDEEYGGTDISGDDAHPYTAAADYATAAGTFTPETATDAEADDGEPEPGRLLDGLDPKLANYIQKLRRGAADKRIAVAELHERLQAARTEIAELHAWQQDRLRSDVEALAGGYKLMDPAEIWHVTTLPELLDEHGDIDEAKLAELIDARVPQHWRVQVKYPGSRSGFMSGSTGLTGSRPASWSQALGGPQA